MSNDNDDFKFFAGRYNCDYNNMETYGEPPPLAGVRYSWNTGVLGGAHEYGDNQIVDARTGNTIFACDSDEDAEELCRLLNFHCAEHEWGA